MDVTPKHLHELQWEEVRYKWQDFVDSYQSGMPDNIQIDSNDMSSNILLYASFTCNAKIQLGTKHAWRMIFDDKESKLEFVLKYL